MTSEFYYSYYKKEGSSKLGIELMIGPLIIEDLLSDLKRASNIAKEFNVTLKDYDLNLGKEDDLEEQLIKVFAVKLEIGENAIIKNKEYKEKLFEAYNIFVNR